MPSSTMPFVLSARPLTLHELRLAFEQPLHVSIDDDAWPAVHASHAAVQRLAAGNEPAYGINTGFGLLANTRIALAERNHLQRNIVLSHSAGVGPLLDDAVVRLTLLLKVQSFLRGYSGVSESLIRLLARMLDAGLYPCVPSQGSVGASGDLAPLAHMSLPLIGLGSVRYEGRVLSGAQALAQMGAQAIELGPKEGLALLNGTQVSTSLALAALFAVEQLIAASAVVGALAVDAMKGSDAPFDPRLHTVRGQPGQIAAAEIYRQLLAGSAIRRSHLENDERVQDPYSLRCQPQVMGACLDLIVNSTRTLLIEANAVTDNPLVYADLDEIISGGNFHAEPVAFAA
ncbi:MAG: aromatic amino acid lyase, partial [Steroidobacteraceae bacterium]